MSHSISESTKALLTGGLTGPQQAAEKAKAKTDDDMVALHEQDALVVKMASNAVKGGTPQISPGAKLTDDLKVAAFGHSISTVKAARRFTQAEIDQEARMPNAQGQDAIRAIMRLQRKQAQ